VNREFGAGCVHKRPQTGELVTIAAFANCWTERILGRCHGYIPYAVAGLSARSSSELLAL